MPDSNEEPWETSDLGVAAYIHGIGGLEILGSRRTRPDESGGGRFMFMFPNQDDQCDRLQLEFLNSKCRKFDAAVRSLKKLCHPQKARRR